MADEVEVERTRALEKIRASLARRGSPRAQMSVIVAATGCAGFLSSFVLLHIGLRLIWLRYELAIALAYAAFLGLVGAWLALQRRKLGQRAAPRSGSGGSVLDVVNVDPGGIGGGVARGAARVAGGGGKFGGGGASMSFDEGNGVVPAVMPVPVPMGEAPGATAHAASAAGRAGGGAAKHVGNLNLDIDLDDAVVIVAIIAATGAAITASVYVVATAPALLAEVMFDGALSTGLYRRLRTLNHHQWWEDAIRHTAIPVATVMVFFGIAGFLMHRYAPEAVSIGGVFRHLLHKGS